MNVLHRFLARCRRMAAAEDGASTVEFVIAFPLVFSIFLLGVDSGLTQVRQVFVDRAVDIAIRDVRLGNISEQDNLAQMICDNTIMIVNCMNSITIEMQPVPTDTFAGLDQPTQCINRTQNLTPAVEFNPGDAQQQLMLIRVCVVADPFINFTGYISAIPRNMRGEYVLMSHSVFVNEPR